MEQILFNKRILYFQNIKFTIFYLSRIFKMRRFTCPTVKNKIALYPYLYQRDMTIESSLVHDEKRHFNKKKKLNEKAFVYLYRNLDIY